MDATCLEELVHQFDPDTIADEYVNTDECLIFEKADNWRQELRSMVYDAILGCKQAKIEP